MPRGDRDPIKSLLIKRHSDKGGILAPQKPGDVGYDLKIAEEFEFPFAEIVTVPCDFSMKIPEGYFALIVGRSSAISKHEVQVFPSIIDENFTGPIFTVAKYVGGAPALKLPEGTRLAQMILLQGGVVPIKEVDELPKTERGSDGWGSTG